MMSLWVYVRKKYEINRFSTSFYCLSPLRLRLLLLRIAKNNALLSEWYMNKFLWTQSSFIFEQNCPIQINFFTLSFFVISLKNKTRNIFETRFSVPKVLLVANVCNNNHSNEYNSSFARLKWKGLLLEVKI